MTGVGGVVEKSLHCGVDYTKQENWHNNKVLYDDQIVFLLGSLGFGHHEESENEYEEDAAEKNDVGCATEVVSCLKMGTGRVRPDATDDRTDETCRDDKID